MRSTASSPTPRAIATRANSAHAVRITQRPNSPARLIDSATPMNESGEQQAASRVLPPDQRLGGEYLAGAHVDLGQVVQDQRAVLDHALQMQFDVVAELALQRHVVGEHRDLVAAGVLGGQHRLIGPAEQVRGGVATRNTQCDTDADRAGEHLAVDRHPFAQRRLKAIGQRLCGVGSPSATRARRRTRRRRGGRSDSGPSAPARSRSASTRMNQSPAVWPR